MKKTEFKKYSQLEKIWLLAPVAIWFSYKPLISFGRNDSMNFELSVTIIYVTILALFGLPSVWKSKKTMILNKAVQLVTLFVLFSGLSIFWSTNRTRGVLTLGVIGLLYAIFLGGIANILKLKKLLPTLARLLILTAIIMSVLSFIQFIAGIWLTPDQTLLCAGCTANQFGFPRPNVFTIEPQFFGNVILAPALILLKLVLIKKQTIYKYIGLIVLVTALFLTLSRGSIFAFCLGVLVLLAAERSKLHSTFKAGISLVLGVLMCLLMQSTAGAINPNIDITFKGAASTSINQLSLGLIDLNKLTAPKPVVTESVQTIAPSPAKQTPNYTGYVAQSTIVRVRLSNLAMQSWSKSYDRMFFGVGLGASGTVLRKDFPNQVNTHEIVQNEYAETLLEYGLVGTSLFGALFGGLIYSLRKNKWSWAIVLVYLVQWIFFSGYPNTLHIYLILTLLFIGLGNSSSSKIIYNSKQ